MNAAKSKNMSKTSRRTWARASKLAELAGIQVSVAREFLSQKATDDEKALLDNGADKRSKSIRTLIHEAQCHAGVAQKESYGVPEAYRSSCGGAVAAGLVKVSQAGKTWVAEPEPEEEPSKMPQVPMDLLFDIKGLIDKYDVDTVTQGLSTLLYLRNEH